MLDWSGSIRAIAVMRIAIGPITLLHLRPFLRDAAAGVSYDDHFWQPFVAWLPELPAGVWFALLWVGAAAAVLMTIGLWTRLATVTAFAVVAGNLLLSQTHFHNNRAFLVILLGGLALLPAGRLLSIDSWWRRRAGKAGRARRRRPLAALAAAGPGLPRLPGLGDQQARRSRLDRRARALGSGGALPARARQPLPGWASDLLVERWPFYAIGPAAVLTELFIGVGLWFGRTRARRPCGSHCAST